MHQLPFVSVIVPVKNRPDSTRKLVESFLLQSYPEDRRELIIVGDIGDKTWFGITDYLDKITVIEASIVSEGRDANAKRNVGLERAKGDILALTDSDVILPDLWIQAAVKLLSGESNGNYQAVAGGLVSISENSFLGNYIDLNPVGSKTSRMNPAYLLTRHNNGRGRCKPPITANLFFTREVYEVTQGLDADFTTPYEDYPFADKILNNGFNIFCTFELDAFHEHRTQAVDLLDEYWQAGIGCADYVLKYGESHMARSRLFQLVTLMTAAPTWLLMLAVKPFLVLTFTLMACVLLSLFIVAKVHRPDAAFYLAVTVVLSILFALGMIFGFVKRKLRQQAPTQIISHNILSTSQPKGLVDG